LRSLRSCTQDRLDEQLGHPRVALWPKMHVIEGQTEILEIDGLSEIHVLDITFRRESSLQECPERGLLLHVDGVRLLVGTQIRLRRNDDVSMMPARSFDRQLN